MPDLATLRLTWEPRMLSILRIIVGLLYMEHGLAKVLGFPLQPNHAPYALLNLNPGLQGLLELVGGLLLALGLFANFGVSDRRFRFKPAGGFGGNRQAVSVQSGTPLRMGFGPDFGEPPLRDTSYLALVCQSKYSCHYYRL